MWDLTKAVNGLARSLVPELWRARRRMAHSRAEVAEWMASVDTGDEEVGEMVGYLRRGTWRNMHFPYPFAEKYTPESIRVFHDRDNGLGYVLHGGRRLYFPLEWSAYRIREAYLNLLVEQDEESPHCYEGGECRVQDGDVVLDAGAAEGVFALSVIDRARKLVVVEGSKEWFAPLEATFRPFRDKVRIVRRFISEHHDPENGLTFARSPRRGRECHLC